MGKLRDAMLEEMNLRGFRFHTKKGYIQSMEKFFKFIKKKEEELNQGDIKIFQLYLRKRNLEPVTISRHLSAVYFFYQNVLKISILSHERIQVRRRKKVPTVLSKEEMNRMISSCKNLKHKAMIMTLYSTGMRMSELQNLRSTDIDSKRTVINIRDGKGGRDRQALLSANLLKVLRKYWKENKDDKSRWLFPIRESHGLVGTKMGKTSISYLVKHATKVAEIKKSITSHSSTLLCRPSFRKGS